jgi:DNA-binding NtrC family response regulator
MAPTDSGVCERTVFMLDSTPLVIANDPALSLRIVETLAPRFGRRVEHCTVADSRRRIAWHHPGTAIFVGSRVGDRDLLANIVRERRLRQSPQTLVVVEAGCSIRDGLDRDLAAAVARWCEWPQDADLVANAIECVPSSGTGDTPLDQVLQDRLSEFTPSLAPMARRLAVAAMHDVTVLLTGETGTGKTYLARLLHEMSPRRDERFLIIPCGAQPAELFESSVFGHVKGSFTGAHQNQPGKFATAGKGTILLDEVDALGFEQQAVLLRVIETGEYEMVGSTQTLKSEARLIVASNTNLEDAVQRGQFRQDLFYRLNVMAFDLPPLRTRSSDIPRLARGFAAQYAAKYGKPICDITDDAMQALCDCPWTGNIRQLENAIQQAVLVCRGSELAVEDLPDDVKRRDVQETASPNVVVEAASNGHAHGIHPPAVGSLMSGRAEYERLLIQRALVACQNNRSSAARALGVSRVTLHKKIKMYGL